MPTRLGKFAIAGVGAAFLLAPVLTGQAVVRSRTGPDRAVAAPAAIVRSAGAAEAARLPRTSFAGPTLHHGAHGAAVTQLQRRLRDLGYDPGKADGRWGADTSFAVWAFQKVNHIKPGSSVGMKTWAALARPRTPKPLVPKGAKTRAEVDIKHQLLYVYADGRLALTSHISSGSEQAYYSRGSTRVAHTPRGRFRVYRKASGWERSPLGVLYKANYFDGGYAIHGEPAVPLHPASHGCVRVPMSTSAIVSRLLPVGTRVYVH